MREVLQGRHRAGDHARRKLGRGHQAGHHREGKGREEGVHRGRHPPVLPGVISLK